MAELESSKEMEKDVTTSLAKWKAGRVAVAIISFIFYHEYSDMFLTDQVCAY